MEIKRIKISPGYDLYRLTSEDLLILRELVSNQYTDVIKQCLGNDQYIHEIPKYHLFGDSINHNNLWGKLSRSLPQSSVDIIKNLHFIRDLKSTLGEFSISKLAYGTSVNLDIEEIYWRLVRPGSKTDVGVLHADKWFHELLGSYGTTIPLNSNSLKIWIPLYCEAGKSGLMVVPDSHTKQWSHKKEIINGSPVIAFLDSATPILVSTQPGEAIIFNDSLLHCGNINVGSETRVSMEITMVFENCN